MKEPAWWASVLAVGVGLGVGAVCLRRPTSSCTQDCDRFVSVAMIGVVQDAHVKELFKKSKIPVVTWGGSHSGYWVQVPESEAYRAIAVLRKDVRQAHYYVHFGDQHPFSGQEEEWIRPWVDASYSELLSRPPYLSSTEVGACLRQPEVASVAQTYSKISRIRYWRRKVFETPGRSPLLEELWLEKFPESPGAQRRISVFQIIDGEGEVHCITDRAPD